MSGSRGVNFFSSKKNNQSEKDNKSYGSHEPLVFQFDEEIQVDNITNATRSQRVDIPRGKKDRDVPDVLPSVKNSVAESLYVAGFNDWMLHKKNKEVRKQLDALGQNKEESKKEAKNKSPMLMFDHEKSSKETCNDFPVVRGFDIKISL